MDFAQSLSLHGIIPRHETKRFCFTYGIKDPTASKIPLQMNRGYTTPGFEGFHHTSNGSVSVPSFLGEDYVLIRAIHSSFTPDSTIALMFV